MIKVWYTCDCGKKILKIDPSKEIEGVFIKCRKCSKEVEIVNHR